MDEKELKEAIASLVKENKRQELAELITEFVDPHHLTLDVIGLFLNTRALNINDVLVKKVRTGIRVRTLVPGSIHLASEITVRDRINYVLDGADVRVLANLWELESGEIGTVESIKSEMQAKLRDYYMNKVFLALNTVWSAVNTPSNYINVGGPLTATVLRNAIDWINQNTGGVRAVVGTRAALTPVTTFGAGWTDGAGTSQPVPSNIEEIMRTGFLGQYYGARLIALQQEYDNPADYNALLPTDKVLVIGENAGEFITYGPVQTKEWTNMEPTPPYWNYELYQQFGLVVDKADGIFVIDGLS